MKSLCCNAAIVGRKEEQNGIVVHVWCECATCGQKCIQIWGEPDRDKGPITQLVRVEDS